MEELYMLFNAVHFSPFRGAGVMAI